jgi:hypothetical protein
MLAGRVVATAHVTALLTEPEVDPTPAGPEAFLTPFGSERGYVSDFNQMPALLRHDTISKKEAPFRGPGFSL